MVERFESSSLVFGSSRKESTVISVLQVLNFLRTLRSGIFLLFPDLLVSFPSLSLEVTCTRPDVNTSISSSFESSVTTQCLFEFEWLRGKGSVWGEENPGKGEKYWDEVFRLEVEDLKDVDDYGLLLCMGPVPKSQIRVFQSSRKSEGRSLLARDEMDFRGWLARSSRGEIVLLARKSFLSSSDFFCLRIFSSYLHRISPFVVQRYRTYDF
ncbi:unnamed protein product [Nezara viridula]|uniref:Uncharacterized protein n=1 Tax=Nezara viridula TaxID=85310 RepID=A0A9P0HLZ6_NEZVI|nr:unnamed protein product [Nezara viridula]